MALPDRSLKAVIGETKSRLKSSGIQSAEFESRLLISHVTGLSHAQLISSADHVLPSDVLAELERLIVQRLRGRSVHRIIGHREFYGRRFLISDDTLEPRPDTEILVDQVLKDFGESDQQIRFIDIGTGTGVIAITLACERANFSGIGTDIEAGCLKIASKNAENLGVQSRIEWVETNYFDGVEDKFDIIVSNPPYIRSGDIADLEREVREHDPAAALDGGPDGLDAYRHLLKHAGDILQERGRIYLEIGFDQSESVTGLATDHGWLVEAVVKDLSGVRRVVVASRQ